MMVGSKRRIGGTAIGALLFALALGSSFIEEGAERSIETSTPPRQPERIKRESAKPAKPPLAADVPSPAAHVQPGEPVRDDDEPLEPSADEASPAKEAKVAQPPSDAGGSGPDPSDEPEPAAEAAAATLIVPEFKPETRTLSLRLAAGDTFIQALRKLGVSARDTASASSALSDLLDPRSFRPGQTFQVRLRATTDDTEDLCLEELQFSPGTDRWISLEHRSHAEFAAAETPVEHAQSLVLREGSIETSMYEAARAAEVPAPVLLEMYGVLAHAVDFQRDVRAGDPFAVAYDVFDDGEGRLHEGGLRYAALGAGEDAVKVFRYVTSDGFEGFFDEDGASLATSLLRTPVDGARLSSLYGRREHPVLNYTRMHRGLDFAAPRGTPVMAAGDGVIARRERFGSFGNYVRIEHDTPYATAYAHLSDYAQGLRPGERVRQGEVIGYVGATGLVSGPNLHFEVLREGRQVDPMRLELPPRKRLSGDELVRFRQAMTGLLAEVSADAGSAHGSSLGVIRSARAETTD